MRFTPGYQPRNFGAAAPMLQPKAPPMPPMAQGQPDFSAFFQQMGLNPAGLFPFAPTQQPPMAPDQINPIQQFGGRPQVMPLPEPPIQNVMAKPPLWGNRPSKAR